jgi:hemolysin activation/secretion protein
MSIIFSYSSGVSYFFTIRQVIASVSLLLISTMVAADIPVIPAEFNPSSIAPGVIGNTIANSPIPTTTNTTPKFVMPHETKPSPMSAEASEISFVLHGVIMKGNNVFTDSELEAIFQPYLHHKITVAALQKLVQSITDKYQKEGYFLSKALLPPQQIDNGIVRVTIIEGFISQINVQGVDRKALITFIQKYGDKIKAIKPIKLEYLERYLLLMNDIPGMSIKSVMEPDPKVPLGAALTLITEHTPIQAIISYDNYQTPYLGPNESTLFTSLNSVFAPGGTLSTRSLTANHYHKLNFYELRYDQALGANGFVFSLDGYSTQTNPQFILAPLEVLGTNTDLNATISYPLIRSRLRSLSVQGQFDYMTNSLRVLREELYKDQMYPLHIAG